MLPGRILKMIMPGVVLHEDYDLPPTLPRAALAICISWSGNTEETVSAYQKAREMNLETLVITSGGTLTELAQKNSTPLVLLPNDDVQPRMAVGYMTGALLEIMGLGDQIDKSLELVSDRASSEEVPGAVEERR